MQPLVPLSHRADVVFETPVSPPVYLWHPSSPKVSETVRIYLEGDGRAWIKRGWVSPDPTPKFPLVHHLINADKKQDVAYIARPCQYAQNRFCTKNLWTMDQYSAPVIGLINHGISEIKAKGGYRDIELVAYSGGAAVALLLAATQRNDIRSIRTVAGNLAPGYIYKIHGMLPVTGALSPTDFSAQLSTIPQIHFYGNKDRIVPGAVSQHYISHFSSSECIASVVVPADHQKGWSGQWAQLLDMEPGCAK